LVREMLLDKYGVGQYFQTRLSLIQFVTFKPCSFIFLCSGLKNCFSNLWQEKISTSCGKVCQWHKAGRCFSLGLPVSSTNKTDRLDMTDILLKVALNTITITSTIMLSKLILAGRGYPSFLMNSKMVIFNILAFFFHW
jgi:hypothetical protein